MTLVRNRHLLWQFILRNIEVRTKGSYLGTLWLVLNPLMMMGLYTLVFGVIVGSRFGVMEDETGLDFALGVFLGITIFNLVSEIFGASPTIIVQNANLVKRVVFPLEVLPVAAVGSAFYHFLITLALSLGGILAFGPPLTAAVLWFPVIILPIFLIVLGMGWLFSALGVYFRDLQHLTSFFSLAFFYASGIFFSAQTVKERAPEAWVFLKWNPFLHAIELTRDILLWDVPVSWQPLLYLYVVGLVSCATGYAVFVWLRPQFADVI